MRLLIIVLSLTLMSCERGKKVKVKGIVGETKPKYCIKACMEEHFEMFHNEGDSWGTGSSSMNGLSQQKIFDRVEQQCEKFMKGEKCCKWTYNQGKQNNLEYSFGGIGVCNQDYWYWRYE